VQGEANKKYGAQAYKLSEEVFTACASTYLSSLWILKHRLTFGIRARSAAVDSHHCFLLPST
jgi:hypothetical protein